MKLQNGNGDSGKQARCFSLILLFALAGCSAGDNGQSTSGTSNGGSGPTSSTGVAGTTDTTTTGDTATTGTGGTDTGSGGSGTGGDTGTGGSGTSDAGPGDDGSTPPGEFAVLTNRYDNFRSAANTRENARPAGAAARPLRKFRRGSGGDFMV